MSNSLFLYFCTGEHTRASAVCVQISALGLAAMLASAVPARCCGTTKSGQDHINPSQAGQDPVVTFLNLMFSGFRRGDAEVMPSCF